MRTSRTWIRNVSIVLPQRTVNGHVCIDDDHIHSVILDDTNSKLQAAEDIVIDGSGMLLLPGLIDCHSDVIEKEVEPRPKTLIPLELALFELEKKLAAAGVTTMYHALSLGTGLSLRGNELMQDMVNTISRYRQMNTMIRHRVHLRFELTHFTGLPIAQQLIEDNHIDYFSYMNHAPGQGQYKRPGSFEAYVMKNQGVSQAEVEAIVDELMAKQSQIDWAAIERLTEQVLAKGLRIASHDDDSIKQIDDSIKIGSTVSEFPLNLETARYASESRMSVCVGAPNIIRGQSHDGNLGAIDAIKAHAANVICSDYAPSLMLPAVFKLIKEGITQHEAVNMVSLNPAKALGIDSHYGSIEEGKKADLLLVELIGDYPSIRKTIVNGKVVYESHLHHHS